MDLEYELTDNYNIYEYYNNFDNNEEVDDIIVDMQVISLLFEVGDDAGAISLIEQLKIEE